MRLRHLRDFACERQAIFSDIRPNDQRVNKAYRCATRFLAGLPVHSDALSSMYDEACKAGFDALNKSDDDDSANAAFDVAAFVSRVYLIAEWRENRKSRIAA